MAGINRLDKSMGEFAQRKKNEPLRFSGLLGIPTNGEYQVECPGRRGYVWVRLRNHLNEVIQAHNQSVSPVYDLPVIIERDEFNPRQYKVIGRDIGRYSDWGSSSAYGPSHGNSHSFNGEGSGGGDVVWVYSRQFLPFLVVPSGSAGAMSVWFYPHTYYWSDEFHYAGNTGIAIPYTLKPTGSSNGIMHLLFIEPDTGNIGLVTGTVEFSATLTGTAQIIGYIPALIDPQDIPLAGVRLVSGTSIINWDNLYDVRDIYGTSILEAAGGKAPTNAQYVTLATNGILTQERVLTAGTDVTIADGGANGNVTVGVSTGTFSRAGHTHSQYSTGTSSVPTYPAIYDDSTFKTTGTALSFGSNLSVAVTGTVAYVDATAGGGGSDLLIYDDSTFKTTGTALSFGSDLDVSVTGSTAFIRVSTGTFSRADHTHPAGVASLNGLVVYDGGTFKATGTVMDFGANLDVTVTGTTVFVSAQAGGGGGGDGSNGHITVMGLSYASASSASSGTWTYGNNSSSAYQTYVTNFSDGMADGDEILYSTYLSSGTYTLLVVPGYTNGFCAILDVYIDATKVATHDLYSAGTNYATRFLTTGISITSTGSKTIKFKVNGRNASSSEWRVSLSYFAFWRTG